MTTLAPEAVDESLDPRDPLLRLSRFFDDGSLELLHERDRSGVLAAAGTVNGLRTIAFCTDGTVMALRDQVVPATLNLVNLDPEVDLDVVAGNPRPGDYRYAVNNSFGFGGHNVAIAFGRY